MSDELHVFLVSFSDGERCIVYSDPLDGQTDENNIYNAGSLRLITNRQVTDFVRIDGKITARFGVKPLVLGFSGGRFEVFYAPTTPEFLFRSDGTLATHGQNQVKTRSVISIPDERSKDVYELIPIRLNEPNESTISTFIQMSSDRKEYSEEKSYIEMIPDTMKKADEELRGELVRVQAETSRVQEELNRVKDDVKEELNRVKDDLKSQLDVTKSELVTTKNELEELKFKVTEMEKIIETMNRRMYRIYPVEIPTHIKIGEAYSDLIDAVDAKEKLASGSIEKIELIPSLQPYAGSQQSANRLVTIYDKQGNLYHSRVVYDAESNTIEEPL